MGEQKGNTDGHEIPGPRYEIRIADLRAWHVLTASCHLCGHARRFRLETLVAFAGGPEQTRRCRLVDIDRRLRCGRCGQREARMMITMARRD